MTQQTTFRFPSQLEAERIIEQQRQRIDTLSQVADKWNDAIATLPQIAKLENGGNDIEHIFEVILPKLRDFGADIGDTETNGREELEALKVDKGLPINKISNRRLSPAGERRSSPWFYPIYF